jgi:hypothetical protein
MYSSLTISSCSGVIGSVAVVDLRVMGVAARKRNVAELADQLFPWAWIGFVLAIISGFYVFATDAADWAPSPAFHVKLTLIAVSSIVAYVVQRGAHKWP